MNLIFTLISKESKKDYHHFFYEDLHDGKDHIDYKYKLTSRLDSENNSYTISGFLYLIDWKYRYFLSKNVLKRDKSINIYLDKVLNNLVFEIYVGDTPHIFKIKNVDINRWFHFAIIVSDLHVDIYYNGKLYSANVLSSLPKIDRESLEVCKNGGFSGYLANLLIYDKSKNHSEVLDFSRNIPTLSQKYFKDMY